MFGLVVMGPPGSGKSSVLTALQNLLADDGVRHAVIEVEALAWAHPPLADEHSFRHLSAVRELYADVGYELIVCGATVTSDSYLSALLGALSPTERLVVRLDASAGTLRQRIVDREPPEWSGLSHLVSATEEIARASRLIEHVDVTFSTEDASPREIASRIRDTSPLLRPQCAPDVDEPRPACRAGEP